MQSFLFISSRFYLLRLPVVYPLLIMVEPDLVPLSSQDMKEIKNPFLEGSAQDMKHLLVHHPHLMRYVWELHGRVDRKKQGKNEGEGGGRSEDVFVHQNGHLIYSKAKNSFTDFIIKLKD